MYKKLCLLLLCLFIVPVFSQNNNYREQKNEIHEKVSADIPYQEINSYKQLIFDLELQKQNFEKENTQIQNALAISNQAFDRVTNTYWALLGIIITIVIFIFSGNIIFQHIDRKRISKEIYEEILLKCMDELNNNNKKNKQEIQNTFEEIDKKNLQRTNEAIKGVKKLQLELLKQELEKDKTEEKITSSMNKTLEIIGIYFELYGEDQYYNQYDGDINDNFQYLKKCLNEGHKFWCWNIESINQLRKKCPERLSNEFHKVLELAEYDHRE